MFKRAHEVVSKNNYLYKEMPNIKTIIMTVNIKFKITIKYVSSAIPAHLNPCYNVLAININKE